MSSQRNVMQQVAEPRRSIREAKASGLRNLPCRGNDENAAWLEAVLTGIDLVCWTKLICFAHTPELARCEIAAFRYRVLHVAARLTRSARRLHLRIDRTWRWATQIAEEDMARFVLDVHELAGVTVVLIEHDMNVVMDISNRISVLDFGRLIADGTPDEVSRNADVVKAYLGEEAHA
jgi:hypothetical protein